MRACACLLWACTGAACWIARRRRRRRLNQSRRAGRERAGGGRRAQQAQAHRKGCAQTQSSRISTAPPPVHLPDFPGSPLRQDATRRPPPTCPTTAIAAIQRGSASVTRTHRPPRKTPACSLLPPRRQQRRGNGPRRRRPAASLPSHPAVKGEGRQQAAAGGRPPTFVAVLTRWHWRRRRDESREAAPSPRLAFRLSRPPPNSAVRPRAHPSAPATWRVHARATRIPRPPSACAFFVQVLITGWGRRREGSAPPPPKGSNAKAAKRCGGQPAHEARAAAAAPTGRVCERSGRRVRVRIKATGLQNSLVVGASSEGSGEAPRSGCLVMMQSGAGWRCRVRDKAPGSAPHARATHARCGQITRREHAANDPCPPPACEPPALPRHHAPLTRLTGADRLPGGRGPWGTVNAPPCLGQTAPETG